MRACGTGFCREKSMQRATEAMLEVIFRQVPFSGVADAPKLQGGMRSLALQTHPIDRRMVTEESLLSQPQKKTLFYCPHSTVDHASQLGCVWIAITSVIEAVWPAMRGKRGQGATARQNGGNHGFGDLAGLFIRLIQPVSSPCADSHASGASSRAVRSDVLSFIVSLVGLRRGVASFDDQFPKLPRHVPASFGGGEGLQLWFR
jgi:hypothetical protein